MLSKQCPPSTCTQSTVSVSHGRVCLLALARRRRPRRCCGGRLMQSFMGLVFSFCGLWLAARCSLPVCSELPHMTYSVHTNTHTHPNHSARRVSWLSCCPQSLLHYLTLLLPHVSSGSYKLHAHTSAAPSANTRKTFEKWEVQHPEVLHTSCFCALCGSL